MSVYNWCPKCGSPVNLNTSGWSCPNGCINYEKTVEYSNPLHIWETSQIIIKPEVQGDKMVEFTQEQSSSVERVARDGDDLLITWRGNSSQYRYSFAGSWFPEFEGAPSKSWVSVGKLANHIKNNHPCSKL